MARIVKIGPANFNLQVDSDPICARFIASTSADLDHLDNEEDVEMAIGEMEEKLGKVTGIAWHHDSGDPGAGYSFIPDGAALAQKIEKAFPEK